MEKIELKLTPAGKKLNFLMGLAKLTKKYGISIGSCGCCDSMWLTELENKKLGRNHGYQYCEDGDRFEGIFWCDTSDYDEEEIKDDNLKFVT